MSIKRIIATSATLLLGLMSINAAATHLTVELKAGNKYSFLLADKPVITFSNGDLVVNGDAETSYSIDGVTWTSIDADSSPFRSYYIYSIYHYIFYKLL